MRTEERHRQRFMTERPGRIVIAILATGCGSLIPMLISVVLANAGGLVDVGHFGVVFAVFLLSQQVVRDSLVNSFVAQHPNPVQVAGRPRLVSTLGILLGVLLVLGSLAFRSSHLAMLALGIHGMVLGSYAKTVSLSLGRGKGALAQESATLIGVLAFTLTGLFIPLHSDFVIAGWIACSAMSGYASCLVLRYDIVPGKALPQSERLAGTSFGIQGLIGSGATHLLTIVLAAVESVALVGVLRISGTVLGPANLVISSLQPILLTKMGILRLTNTGRVQVLRAYFSMAGAITLVVGAILIVLLLASFTWGSLIFATSWDSAKWVVAVMSLDVLFVSFGVIPQLAHRISWAHKEALRITVITFLVRIPAVLVGAAIAGATGAAFGFLLSTAVSTTAWWISCRRLLQSQSTGIV